MPTRPKNRARYPADWKAIVAKVCERIPSELRCKEFDAYTVRCAAADTGLMPDAHIVGLTASRYIKDEIGTRLIDHFKRAGSIEKVQGTRKWKWVHNSMLARTTTENEK